MSMEAIQTIRDVERAVETAKAEARTKAQKCIAEAQREGNALLEQTKASAAEKTAEVMDAARKKGEKNRLDILGQTEQECRRMAAGAEGNMATAARMILRRVVES